MNFLFFFLYITSIIAGMVAIRLIEPLNPFAIIKKKNALVMEYVTNQSNQLPNNAASLPVSPVD